MRPIAERGKPLAHVHAHSHVTIMLLVVLVPALCQEGAGVGVPNSQKATRTWASALRKTLAILARQAGVPGMGRSPDEDGDGLILVWPSCLRSMLWDGRHVWRIDDEVLERCSWLARVTSVTISRTPVVRELPIAGPRGWSQGKG